MSKIIEMQKGKVNTLISQASLYLRFFCYIGTIILNICKTFLVYSVFGLRI